MSSQFPTEPLEGGEPPSPWESMLRFWSLRRNGSVSREWLKRMTGPWGRFVLAVVVGLLFVVRPTTIGAVLFCGLLGLVASWGRHNRLLYAPVAVVVGVIWGSVEVAVLALVILLSGDGWTRRAMRPDPMAMRLHARIAAVTKAPVTEDFWRRETFVEARDRVLTLGRGGAANPARRIRKREERPLNPVPRWLTIDYTPPGAPYPIAGFRFHYPPGFADDNPTRRQEVLAAAASKLPPMPDGNPPTLTGSWQTDRDFCYAKVGKPLPDWVNLTDLPEIPDSWGEVAAFGVLTPDSPLAGTIEEDDTLGLAIWNPDSESCPVPQAPHVIVIGPTGSYKTTVVRALIHGAQERMHARVDAIDGKREGAFAYLDGTDGGRETADPAIGAAWVLAAYAEMDARYDVNDQRKRQQLPPVRWRPHILVIDEGMSWLDQLAGNDILDDVTVKLVDLLRRGRTGRILVIWSTQRPDVRGVSGVGTIGQMRDQFGLKIIGSGSSETAVRMVAGDSNGKLAGDIPTRPRGRLGVMVGETFTLAQHAWSPDPLGIERPDEPGPYIDSARDHLQATNPTTEPPSEPTTDPDAPTQVTPINSRRGRATTP